MGKMFLFILGAVGLSVVSIMTDTPALLIPAVICYVLAGVAFIKAILDLIRSFVNTHRQVRQSIDDERIRKFHEYGKGDGNGL